MASGHRIKKKKKKKISNKWKTIKTIMKMFNRKKTKNKKKIKNEQKFE